MSIMDSDALFAEVVQRMRLAAQDDRTFDTAQMQLINLPEIIASAGPDWPAMKDRIRAGSVAFLCACLGDSDLVIPAGDGFLIIFAEPAAPASLKARADELRRLLLEFYVGQEGLAKIQVAASQRQVHARDLHAMLAPPPPPALDLIDHCCTFAPVWSAQAELIAAYFCSPVRSDETGTHFGYDAQYAATGQWAHRDYCALDLHVLDLVEAALAQQQKRSAQAVLGASVHATTMQNRRAKLAYLDRLARVPADLRKHLVVRVAEIEPGSPILNLADWAGMLRARAPRILMEFHPSERQPPNLREVGVLGAGYIASYDGASTVAEQVAQLRRWALGMKTQGLKFAALDLTDPRLVMTAAAAGAHFITSPGLWPSAAQPGPVTRAQAPFGAARKAALARI